MRCNRTLRLLMAVPALLLSMVLTAQTARLQVIHNSPAPTVDIYANGQKLLDDFAFRTATPFIDVPAGVTINVGVALGTSTSVRDTLVNFPVVLQANKRYVVVANGVVGNAQKPFTLALTDMGEESADAAANVGIAFFHGSPDAPNVDILTGGNVVFGNVAYGTFARGDRPYANVPADATYRLSVTPAGQNNTVVATYEANLSFWAGKTAVVFASGFLGGNNVPFEPWVALSNGGTFPLKAVGTPPPPPPAPTATARVQVIHNSPAPTVDVYANGAKLLDDFAFRTATPYIDVPARVDINLGVALGSSTSVRDTLVNFKVRLDSGKTYIVVANGIVGNATKPFTLAVYDNGRETSDNANNVGIQFFHGSPDAPEVDILAGTNVIFDNISYGNFAPNYINVPAANYNLAVTPGNNNSTVVARYATGDLSFWKGKTLTVFASGFLSGSSPAFEPWVALSNGGTFPLQAIRNVQNESDLMLLEKRHTEGGVSSAIIFPNPAREQVSVRFSSSIEMTKQIDIMNIMGQNIITQQLDAAKGINEVVISTEKLSAGQYFIRIKDEAGNVETQRLMIQK